MHYAMLLALKLHFKNAILNTPCKVLSGTLSLCITAQEKIT